MSTFKFYVARTAKGSIVTYGRGITEIIAEGHCREHVERERKTARVDHYEPYVMPKPKFRVGQKIKRTRHYAGNGEYRPAVNPKIEIVRECANSPWTAGSFLIIKPAPIFGQIGEWVREDEYEAVK